MLHTRGCVHFLSVASSVALLLLLPPRAVHAQEQATESTAQREERRASERIEASALLQSIMDAYRAAPMLDVSTTVSVLAEGTQANSDARTSKAEFQFAPHREGVLSFNGYTLHLHEGKIRAFHASNKDAYVEAGDDGSPFYALFNAFGDLPFPEIALALGEDSVEDVCMQLLSHTPDVSPSHVKHVRSAEGKLESLHLFLEADGQRLEFIVDPVTKFVRSSIATVTQGAETEEGTSLIWKSTSIVARGEEAMDAAELWPAVEARQKVDGLQSLVKREPKPPEGDGADIDAPAGGAAPPVDATKIGDAAPLFDLPQLEAGSCALKSLQGKFVLLDFWATWCGPCRAAMPAMTAMLQDFDGRVVGVLVNAGEQGELEARKSRIREVIKKGGVVLEGKHAERVLLDLDGAAARDYGVRAFPTILLLSPEGVILGRWEGWSKSVEQAIRDAVKTDKMPPEDGA